LIFSLLLVLALFGLTLLSRAAIPSAPIGDVSKLSPEALKPPTALQQALATLKTADTLFWTLTVLFAAILLSVLGWWSEAGFNRPSRWRNLYLLLIFPLVIFVFTLSDGFLLPETLQLLSGLLVVSIAVLGEEVIFRGLLWRILIPAGPVWTVILTSLLSGALYLARSATGGPWPEAIRLAAFATCAALTYGALRWRTRSIWPPILVHIPLAYAPSIATIGSAKYPIFILASTIGLLLYGLFLLRNRRVRADGC
jgi:membrane protease YdiL (CAAX protease family)